MTWTVSVAVVARGLGIVQLLPGGKVLWNNLEVTDHRTVTPDRTPINRYSRYTTVRLANSDVIVTWDGDQAVEVSVPVVYLGKTCGLCGSCDNNATNDLTLRDGTIITPSHRAYSNSLQSLTAYHLFGVSWSVPLSSRLLVPRNQNCTDEMEPPVPPCNASPTSAVIANRFCKFILDVQGPYASCHHLVDPFDIYQSCSFDVCSCGGNTSCACGVIKEYEKVCKRKGANDIGSVLDSCDVCFGDGSSCGNPGAICVAFGDPHYKTFDGLGLHFQGECEYVLSRDCVANDFVIHVVNEHRGSSLVTWTKSIAIRVKNGGVIVLLPGPSVQVSGKSVTVFPFFSGVDGTQITSVQSTLVVWLASSGVTITWDGSSAVRVAVPEEYRNRTCGLCGNFDGKKINDLAVDNVQFTPSHYPSSLSQQSQVAYHHFGRLWAVTGGDRLLLPTSSPCMDRPTSPPDPCSTDLDTMASANTFCSFISDPQGPYGDCHPILDPLSHYHGCIYDFCASGANSAIACQSVASYELTCRQMGVTSIGSVIDSCGVCFGNGSSCSSHFATCVAAGDPHYTTFDGLGHHFQGQCEYIFARDCLNNQFDIHVLNERQQGSSVSWTKSVAVKVANLGVIKLLRNNEITVNGEKIIKMPRVLSDGSTLRTSDRIVILTLRFGVEVKWDGLHLVEVSVSAQFFNSTCSLCGNYNGDYLDDLNLRDGGTLFVSHREYSWSTLSRMSYHAFGINFAASGHERLLLDPTIPCNDNPTAPSHPCNVTIVRDAAESYCDVIRNRSGPYTLCHSVIDPYGAFESCV